MHKNEEKKYFLRMGSNAEKKYIYKTITMCSGILIKANFFESSSGLLTGLFLKLTNISKDEFFIIDPVSYVFGLNPKNKWSICDWKKVKESEAEKQIRESFCIPSDESIPEEYFRNNIDNSNSSNNKINVFLLKKAFNNIADLYFNNIPYIRKKIGREGLSYNDFTDDNLDLFINNVINYQMNAMNSYFANEKYDSFNLPVPMYILSPYFYIKSNEDYNLMQNIWQKFCNQYTSSNGVLVLLVSKDYFYNNIEKIIDKLSGYKINNIFFWIDDFDEFTISKEEIKKYLIFIKSLSHKKIYNMYGGGFSNTLYPFGLSGLINGPGYGLERKVEPVQGGVPTAQYYIPTLKYRDTVINSYDIIENNGLGSDKNQFYNQICDCPICKNGIKNNSADMLDYYAVQSDPKICKDGKLRSFSSKEALERSTFHFIISRLMEFRKYKSASKIDVINDLEESIKLWGKNNNQLVKWRDCLKEIYNI